MSLPSTQVFYKEQGYLKQEMNSLFELFLISLPYHGTIKSFNVLFIFVVFLHTFKIYRHSIESIKNCGQASNSKAPSQGPCFDDIA
jgi:hypothetical protein